MKNQALWLAVVFLTGACATAPRVPWTAPGGSAPPQTMAELLATSDAADWSPLDPEQTLYLELASGRVIIVLAPAFAPNHVANIKALSREGYFDELAIIRSQDNYVVQWGDAEGNKPIRTAKPTLPPEFSRSAAGLPFIVLAERDTYAPQVGFVDGLPAAREPALDEAWLAHCYGMVGVGRDEAADSGGGTELYAVIGHAPRHLDRNVTLVGRVVQGIALLSTLPRGTADMGFYDRPEQRVPIRSVRVAFDLPVTERTPLEFLRTDSPTFAAIVDSRRNRRESWFKSAVGHIDLCNVPLVVRTPKAASR